MHLVKTKPDPGAALQIAASGFCQPVSAELEKDVTEHIAGGDLHFSFMQAARTVGFAIFNVWDDILYLSGIIMHADYQQRRAVQQAVAAARIEAPSACYLAYRTQSYRMWRAAEPTCDFWFPASSNSSKSVLAELVWVGGRVSQRIGSTFPVHQGWYGGPLYGKKPVRGSFTDQQGWDWQCNFNRGDALICVGKFAVYQRPDLGIGWWGQ